MTQRELNNSYFKWLFDLVCENRYSDRISYEKLLRYLHDTDFIYSIRRDEGRAKDGIALRDRFEEIYGGHLTGPCSVLEMMIALAIRCEESITDNAEKGDRTQQWFWGMIVSLGLGSMTDDRYDIDYVDDVVYKFLHRKYEPNGAGGLFTIRNCDDDLRRVEIWFQLLWYLDDIGE